MGAMLVLMMFIVDVRMLMLHRLMNMRVFMLFGDMEIQPKRHQHRSGDKLSRNWFAEKRD